MKRTARVWVDLWPAIVAGSPHLSADRGYPLAEAPVVLARTRNDEHLGKIVLTV